MPFEEAIRSTRFESPLHKAVLNTVFTANWIRDFDRQQFEGVPIGLQHFNVLRILRGRHPATACPGDIKAVMLDRSPDITRLLDRLVALGWVHRATAEGDRRKVEVGLTPAGIAEADRLKVQLKEAWSAVEGRLTEAEAAQLCRLLDKLREGI